MCHYGKKNLIINALNHFYEELSYLYEYIREVKDIYSKKL